MPTTTKPHRRRAKHTVHVTVDDRVQLRQRLPLVGVQRDVDDVPRLELRNCTCESTIAVETVRIPMAAAIPSSERPTVPAPRAVEVGL